MTPLLARKTPKANGGPTKCWTWGLYQDRLRQAVGSHFVIVVFCATLPEGQHGRSESKRRVGDLASSIPHRYLCFMFIHAKLPRCLIPCYKLHRIHALTTKLARRESDAAGKTFCLPELRHRDRGLASQVSDRAAGLCVIDAVQHNGLIRGSDVAQGPDPVPAAKAHKSCDRRCPLAKC